MRWLWCINFLLLKPGGSWFGLEGVLTVYICTYISILIFLDFLIFNIIFLLIIWVFHVTHPDHTHFPVLPGALHCCDLPPKKEEKHKSKSPMCAVHINLTFLMFYYFSKLTLFGFMKKKKEKENGCCPGTFSKISGQVDCLLKWLRIFSFLFEFISKSFICSQT